MPRHGWMERMTDDPLLSLRQYHPVVIEGMGSYDPRDPDLVAARVAECLASHWRRSPVDKPKLIVTQGDPLEARGISAITPRVAAAFDLSRALVCLDEEIADYHAPNADRDNVILELRYSQMVEVLHESRPGAVDRLTHAVDGYLEEKNRRRRAIGKPPLKAYFRHFAMLQEVTKAACRQCCDGITVAHTTSEISDFSVTSFYQAGLDLGLVRRDEVVPYDERGAGRAR